jgi:2-hydroxychromene-2-carboxylate isomerase
LLGAVFRDIGQVNVPMLAMSENKRTYLQQELMRWSEFHAVKTPLFSAHFPLRTVTALRVYILNPQVGDCIFNAIWQAKENISDESVLIRVLNDNGFAGAALVQQSKQPEVKTQLLNNTQVKNWLF